MVTLASAIAIGLLAAAASAAPAWMARDSLPQSDQVISAVAFLTPTGDNTATATVLIEQRDNEVTVTVDATGLAAQSTHGIHIHEFGDISDRAAGTHMGAHFNPLNKTHACPGLNGVRTSDTHAGDLGNIVADDDGYAHKVFESKMTGVDLMFRSSVVAAIGRGIVLHAAADDCVTQPTGNSGGRIAQGVIGFRNATVIPSVPSGSSALEDAGIPVHAIAVLLPTANSTAEGQAVFVQHDESSPVEITIAFHGLAPNSKHGLHLHAFGDVTDHVKAEAAGPHFNPDNKSHGCPSMEDPDDIHNGDLGNFETDENGEVALTIKTTTISLSKFAAPKFAVGRAMIIHANPDDCVSQPVGNAGARLAQGVVGFRNATLDATTSST
ncbi:Superoxide dismutase [Cu-Zn] [Irineochytrium annulatum]|nr:Superoxide dismutase [Cu-Zn] [Irineochytrium annulatum]